MWQKFGDLVLNQTVRIMPTMLKALTISLFQPE